MRSVAFGREEESIHLEAVGRVPRDALGAADQAPRVVVSGMMERGDRPVRATLHDGHLRRPIESLANEREAVLPERRRVRRPCADGIGRRPELVPITGRRVDVSEDGVSAPKRRVGEPSVLHGTPTQVMSASSISTRRSPVPSAPAIRTLPETNWRSLHGASIAATREPSAAPAGSPNCTSLFAITRSSPFATSISTSGAVYQADSPGSSEATATTALVTAPVRLPAR